MRSRRIAALLSLLVLACGCAASTSEKGGGSESYVNAELGLSMQVPSGWTRAKAWSGIGKSGFVTGFASPGEEATITVVRAAFAGIDCAAAAREALKEVTGSSMATIAELEIGMVGQRIPGGHGATAVADRQGEARYFCHDKTTVVVEGSSPRASFAAHRAELQAVLDTVSYVDASGQSASLRLAEAPRETKLVTHVVKYKGETMAAIVEWYTGSVDNWRAVAQVNEDVSSPNAVLKIGREVKIPARLVVRQEPLPRPKTKPAPQRPTATKSAPPKTGPTDAKPPEERPADGEPRVGGEDAEPLPPVIGPR